MKIIVHFGTGKTGTTSIQFSLAAQRKLLAKHGIYYPDTNYPSEAHHVLQTLFKPAENVLPFLTQHYGGYDQAQKQARKSWRTLKRTIKKKQPKVLVLSSEMFFKPTTVPMLQTFYAMLSEISTDIVPVLYVREPASFYLAKTQQRTRANGNINQPGGERLRDAIEAIEEAFQTQVTLRVFEKEQLVGGDVVQDFVTTFLSDHIQPSMIPTDYRNESISAEAMVISKTFRKVNLPDDDLMPSTDSWRLLAEISKIEAEFLPKLRPTLKPAVISKIQTLSSDYLWLKQDRGIQFTNLDYSKIDPKAVEPESGTVALPDIINVDWQRHDFILYKFLQQEMQPPPVPNFAINGFEFRFSNIPVNLKKIYVKARGLLPR